MGLRFAFTSFPLLPLWEPNLKSSIAFTTVSELDFHLELCSVIISICEYQLCFILP